MVAADDLYLGVWALDPELCVYQAGEPPRAGKYTIEARDGAGLHFAIEWITRDGSAHETSFGGADDGSAVPIAEGAHRLVIERIDERTLDTTVFDGAAKVAWARRTASEAGDLLAVVQESYGPNGDPPSRNFQVYRRVR